jgi:hypothetical protein
MPCRPCCCGSFSSCSLLNLFLFAYWMPTVLNLIGMSPAQAVFAASLRDLGAIFAVLYLGLAIDRIGPERALALHYAAGAAFIAVIALFAPPYAILCVIIFLAGMTIIGSQIGVNGACGKLYPARMRTSGIGWALGIGRLGGIVAPVLGGYLLAVGLPPMHRRSSSSSSSSHPTSSVSAPACIASKRLSTDAGRNATQARRGPDMPLRSCAPRSSSSNRLPRSFRCFQQSRRCSAPQRPASARQGSASRLRWPAPEKPRSRSDRQRPLASVDGGLDEIGREEGKRDWRPEGRRWIPPWLQRQYGLMLFTVLTTISGSAIAALLKYLIAHEPRLSPSKKLRNGFASPVIAPDKPS